MPGPAPACGPSLPPRVIPSCVVFQGRRWPASRLMELAGGWRAALTAVLPAAPAPVALVMPNHPEAVALLAALASFPVPLVLLPPDARTWATSPPLPPGAIVVVPPVLRDLAAAGPALGLRALVAPPPAASPVAPLALRATGIVTLTSGSSGRPKPVFRTMSSVLAQASALVQAFALPAGAGILGMLPLARNHGLVRGLVLAAVLDAPLGLLPAFDHRSALDSFASGRYHYAAGTPYVADVLGRCPLPGPPPPAPRVVDISGDRLGSGVVRAFAARFGITPRPTYGTTELGPVTAPTGASPRGRPEGVGPPLPGVEIRIGDDPLRPEPAGAAGRIWVRSPWRMEGYGYPPSVEPRQDRAGWSPTEDAGVLDGAGHLSLVGRADDCYKTAAGYLVSPLVVADVLRSHPGVRQATVAPVRGRGGIVIGALVEADPALDPADLRRHAARSLPAWSRPHVVALTAETPRLPGGKVDRRAVAEALERLAPRSAP